MEPYPESYSSQFDQEPRDPEREQARANNLLGLAMLAVALLIFGGTFVIGLAYLALD